MLSLFIKSEISKEQLKIKVMKWNINNHYHSHEWISSKQVMDSFFGLGKIKSNLPAFVNSHEKCERSKIDVK